MPTRAVGLLPPIQVPLFGIVGGMKSKYLTWELVAAVGLAAGLGASWWMIALLSFVACGALALSAMWGKRKGKAQ
jgi:hypothetical protein